MAKRKAKRPTDAELVILNVLWKQGPATVRQVNRTLNETRRTGYTTTLKQMQVMTGKGLLARDESCRPQIYRPAFSQEKTRRQLVEHLMDGAFGGSVSKLVLQVLRTKDVSARELSRVETLLNKLEGERK